MSELRQQYMQNLTKMSERFDVMIAAIANMNPGSVAELMEGCSLNEGVYLQRDLRDLNDKAEELKTALGKVYDWSRTALVPDLMESNGVELVKLEGVGRVSLTSDLSASMPDKAAGYAWLIENEAGDLITETVNSSTLKAWLRRRMKDGLDVPEDIFKISMFTRSTITKA